MKKFIRTRKDNGEEVEMFSTSGTIQTIARDPKKNSNGNHFYNFSAKIDMPRGSITCLGQVYENSFEFLGGKPEIGDKYAFAAEVEVLRAGNNKVWSISGHTVDSLDDAMLADIDSM